MQINNLETDTGDSLYYDDGFQIILESHLTYLKNSNGNTIKAIKNQPAYKYEGDFFGLLDYLGIPKKIHHLTLLINNLRHPGDYKPEQQLITIPDIGEVEMIRSIHASHQATI